MTHNIVLHFYVIERSFKLEIKTKDDLNSTLDEIMSRLSVIEQSSNDKPKDEDKPKDKPKDEPKDKETEVESVDEIEKLLNA